MNAARSAICLAAIGAAILIESPVMSQQPRTALVR